MPDKTLDKYLGFKLGLYDDARQDFGLPTKTLAIHKDSKKRCPEIVYGDSYHDFGLPRNM